MFQSITETQLSPKVPEQVYCTRTQVMWKTVLWSDESKFELPLGNPGHVTHGHIEYQWQSKQWDMWTWTWHIQISEHTFSVPNRLSQSSTWRQKDTYSRQSNKRKHCRENYSMDSITQTHTTTRKTLGMDKNKQRQTSRQMITAQT